jgi:hypothetical protein
MLLHRSSPYARHIDVPAIDFMSAGRIHVQTLLVGSALDNFHLGKAYALLVARRCGDTRDHHKLNQLLGLERQLFPLGLFEAIF